MRTDSHSHAPFLLTAFLLCLAAPGWVRAAPRVLPEGEKPTDRRLGELRSLNDDFPFTPPENAEQWQSRAAAVRRRLLVATGLWPMPSATPAAAVVHGKVERDGYTVEKVYLESFPGHYVTGNLYRPAECDGELPAVLSPHGHWPDGRFHDHGEKAVRQMIVEGAERFEVGGRHPLQARCVQLARMGCIVFHYDMVGYADSVQLSHAPRRREALCTAENWGFSSPQAELRLQNHMGLQTYNSIRALDWLLSLPEVDPDRIGVTGASGGGTQTFMLCAVDPRPAVSFPAVMVSTAMQGGCACENACYLRIGTGNIEFAGLFAPRPLGMTAANDWTNEIEQKGLPELKRLYATVGAPDNVMAKALVHFPHNFNYVSRAVMYSWMNKHLGLGLEQPIVEDDYVPLSREEMSVWNEQHPAPAERGEEHERALVRWMTDDARAQLDALRPRDVASAAEYRRVVGGAWDVMLGRKLPGDGEVRAKTVAEDDRGPYTERNLLIEYLPGDEQIPAVALLPAGWDETVIVWADPAGKQALFDAEGRPIAAARRLLDAGAAVLAVDLLGQGEFTDDGAPVGRQPFHGEQRNWHLFAGYTFGYNHPMFAQRVHDLLSAVAFARSEAFGAKRVMLLGVNGAGRWVAGACAQAGDAVEKAALDTTGFRFAPLVEFDHPDFLPGAVKYGDLPGLIALAAPVPLRLAGEGNTVPEPIAAAYTAIGAGDHVTVCTASDDECLAAAVAWLLQ